MKKRASLKRAQHARVAVADNAWLRVHCVLSTARKCGASAVRGLRRKVLSGVAITVTKYSSSSGTRAQSRPTHRRHSVRCTRSSSGSSRAARRGNLRVARQSLRIERRRSAASTTKALRSALSNPRCGDHHGFSPCSTRCRGSFAAQSGISAAQPWNEQRHHPPQPA